MDKHGWITSNQWGSANDDKELSNTIDELFFDILNEDTVEIKCECGCWTLYGKDWPADKHSDWCDVYKKL